MEGALGIGYVLLAGLLLCGAVGAVWAKRLILSALLLGMGSVALAGLFFLLGAPYAGGFELSVGAGLISVLFIVAISLTRSVEVRDEHDER